MSKPTIEEIKWALDDITIAYSETVGYATVRNALTELGELREYKIQTQKGLGELASNMTIRKLEEE